MRKECMENLTLIGYSNGKLIKNVKIASKLRTVNECMIEKWQREKANDFNGSCGDPLSLTPWKILKEKD